MEGDIAKKQNIKTQQLLCLRPMKRWKMYQQIFVVFIVLAVLIYAIQTIFISTVTHYYGLIFKESTIQIMNKQLLSKARRLSTTMSTNIHGLFQTSKLNYKITLGALNLQKINQIYMYVNRQEPSIIYEQLNSNFPSIDGNVHQYYQVCSMTYEIELNQFKNASNYQNLNHFYALVPLFTHVDNYTVPETFMWLLNQNGEQTYSRFPCINFSFSYLKFATSIPLRNRNWYADQEALYLNQSIPFVTRITKISLSKPDQDLANLKQLFWTIGKPMVDQFGNFVGSIEFNIYPNSSQLLSDIIHSDETFDFQFFLISPNDQVIISSYHFNETYTINQTNMTGITSEDWTQIKNSMNKLPFISDCEKLNFTNQLCRYNHLTLKENLMYPFKMEDYNFIILIIISEEAYEKETSEVLNHMLDQFSQLKSQTLTLSLIILSASLPLFALVMYIMLRPLRALTEAGSQLVYQNSSIVNHKKIQRKINLKQYYSDDTLGRLIKSYAEFEEKITRKRENQKCGICKVWENRKYPLNNDDQRKRLSKNLTQQIEESNIIVQWILYKQSFQDDQQPSVDQKCCRPKIQKYQLVMRKLEESQSQSNLGSRQKLISFLNTQYK